MRRHLLLAMGSAIILALGANAQEKAGQTGKKVDSSKFIARFPEPAMVRKEIANHPEQTDEIVKKAALALAENIDNPERLAHSRNIFSEILWSLSSDSSRLSQNQANQAADILLPLFNLQRYKLLDRGEVIADFIFRYGETRQAKSFILGILNGDAPQQTLTKRAVIGLYWGRTFRQDREIFDALLKIANRASGDLRDDLTYTALGALAKVDAARASPVLKKKIERSVDIFNFNKVGSIVSDTQQPELMKALFIKYRTFKFVDPSLNGNPSIGISKEATVEFIAKAENQDLEQGLDVLFRIGGHPPLSRHILLDKLESSNPRNRKAVLNYLSNEIRRGAFIDDSMHAVLNAHLQKEPDVEAAAIIKKSLREIQDRLRKQQ